MKKVFILFFLLIFSYNTSVLSNDLQNQLDKYQKEYCDDSTVSELENGKQNKDKHLKCNITTWN